MDGPGRQFVAMSHTAGGVLNTAYKAMAPAVLHTVEQRGICEVLFPLQLP